MPMVAAHTQSQTKDECVTAMDGRAQESRHGVFEGAATGTIRRIKAARCTATCMGEVFENSNQHTFCKLHNK